MKRRKSTGAEDLEWSDAACGGSVKRRRMADKGLKLKVAVDGAACSPAAPPPQKPQRRGLAELDVNVLNNGRAAAPKQGGVTEKANRPPGAADVANTAPPLPQPTQEQCSLPTRGAGVVHADAASADTRSENRAQPAPLQTPSVAAEAAATTPPPVPAGPSTPPQAAASTSFPQSAATPPRKRRFDEPEAASPEARCARTGPTVVVCRGPKRRRASVGVAHQLDSALLAQCDRLTELREAGLHADALGDVRDSIADLLRRGADANCRSAHGFARGWTPLLLACDAGDDAAVCALLAAGADPNGLCAEGSAFPLAVAAAALRITTCALLLRSGATAGAAPLFCAAVHCSVPLLALLLEHGANPNVCEGGTGWTPLLYAAWALRRDACALLLEKGASVAHRTTGGDSALALAACSTRGGDKEKLRVLRLLLSSVDTLGGEAAGSVLRAADCEGKTAFAQAVEAGEHASAQLLLAATSATACVAPDAAGCTAAHHAARHDCASLLRRMLLKASATHAEALLRATDAAGRTALHVAAEHGAVAAMRRICETEQVAVDGLLRATCGRGLTPLESAVEKGHSGAAEYLRGVMGQGGGGSDGVFPAAYAPSESPHFHFHIGANQPPTKKRKMLAVC